MSLACSVISAFKSMIAGPIFTVFSILHNPERCIPKRRPMFVAKSTTPRLFAIKKKSQYPDQYFCCCIVVNFVENFFLRLNKKWFYAFKILSFISRNYEYLSLFKESAVEVEFLELYLTLTPIMLLHSHRNPSCLQLDFEMTDEAVIDFLWK